MSQPSRPAAQTSFIRTLTLGLGLLAALGAIGSQVGCGGGDDGGPTPPSVLSVTVSPDSIVLPLVGAGRQVTVTAQTTQGDRDVTSDPATSYTIVQQSVAGVTSSGLVLAAGQGTTILVASNAGFRDTAAVVVDTLSGIAVTGLALSPDPIAFTSVGQTRATAASVTWANGARWDNASGAPVTYESANAGVASVNASGVVRAEGEGTTFVRAAFAGRIDSVQVTVDLTVRFAQDVLPLFTQGGSSCTDAGCHPGSGVAQRNLRMNSHASITAGNSLSGPIVIPGDGAGSLLVRVLRGPVLEIGAARMPSMKPSLSSASIELVERWIDQGAQDN